MPQSKGLHGVVPPPVLIALTELGKYDVKEIKNTDKNVNIVISQTLTSKLEKVCWRIFN